MTGATKNSLCWPKVFKSSRWAPSIDGRLLLSLLAPRVRNRLYRKLSKYRNSISLRLNTTSKMRRRRRKMRRPPTRNRKILKHKVKHQSYHHWKCQWFWEHRKKWKRRLPRRRSKRLRSKRLRSKRRRRLKLRLNLRLKRRLKRRLRRTKRRLCWSSHVRRRSRTRSRRRRSRPPRKKLQRMMLQRMMHPRTMLPRNRTSKWRL